MQPGVLERTISLSVDSLSVSKRFKKSPCSVVLMEQGVMATNMSMPRAASNRILSLLLIVEGSKKPQRSG